MVSPPIPIGQNMFSWCSHFPFQALSKPYFHLSQILKYSSIVVVATEIIVPPPWSAILSHANSLWRLQQWSLCPLTICSNSPYGAWKCLDPCGAPLVDGCHGDSQRRGSINVGSLKSWCQRVTKWTNYEFIIQAENAVKKVSIPRVCQVSG